ncbi:hypothetical protein SteCoe_11478 [Stentor coeruleus]|uniref:Uncharacterized protein n=1 Tax=Stentor coeruleus TaxID=5963 RepID=A0A1R2CD48_9CILI|nr:hypothetical protein SteCoe_11478 [Stentor coeruleus]
MLEVYAKLSEDERKILQAYHEKGITETVNYIDIITSAQEPLESFSNANTSLRSDHPLKILQTRIFNDSQQVLYPQQPKVIISKKLRSASTPKNKRTPTNFKAKLNTSKTTLNSSKMSTKAKNSSRVNSTGKTTKENRKSSIGPGSSKVLNIMKIPNWKYEVNKLIRTVFRHSILCSHFREEATKIGGLKILDEYRKYNN